MLINELLNGFRLGIRFEYARHRSDEILGWVRVPSLIIDRQTEIQSSCLEIWVIKRRMPSFTLNCTRIMFVTVFIRLSSRFGRLTDRLTSSSSLRCLCSDPKTYKTFEGVEAGDIGAKCGWNGLDNG